MTIASLDDIGAFVNCIRPAADYEIVRPFDRYNIVSEDDLRMATQKTTMYVDTLPTKRPVM